MTTSPYNPAAAPTGLVRVRGSRPTTQMLRTLLRDPLGCISLIWLALLAVLVFAAPLLPLPDPNEGALVDSLQLPSAAHLLGTDTLGRDILSRLLYGGQPALLGAALAVAVAVLIGGTLGLIAGYVGGGFAVFTSRLSDLIFSLPAIVVLLALAAVWGRSTAVAMLCFGVLLSATFIRLLQSSTHAARRERYVDAAITMGTSTPRILVRHLLPNVAGPVIVQLSLAFGTALLVQASLGFLGLGPEPPAPDWGGMISEASSHLYLQPWLLVPTGVVLALAILSVNLLGDALRGQELDRRKPSALRLAEALPDRPRGAGGIDSTAMISVDALSVSYEQGAGAQRVVDGVSFDIARGEIVAVVGESGSGKTTLGLAALGLLPHPARVVAGDVRVHGVGSIVDRSQRDLRRIRGAEIGMIFQEPMVALDPCYTVRDQLTRPIRRHRRVSRRESLQIARELLAHVGLPDPERVLKLYPHEMSGGMAQRVCIALALSGKPKALVADEPTTALDVTVQAGILDLLRRLAQDDGLAVLLVTHDLGVVADLADRVVVMQAGRVVESGDTVELFADPAHAYTRQLIASTPNILEEVADHGRRESE